jgi:hypothetical protein
MSLWSYCCLCADMADFASRDNNTCNFFPFSSLYFSITQTIEDITISIYAQKSTATDRYWWSFGPAKFESTTARFDAKTRRAITRSISAISCHIIHQNVDDDIVYHHANRYSDKTFLSTLIEYKQYGPMDRHADSASCHNISCRLSWFLSRPTSITGTINDNKRCIYTQKWTSTDPYWWSFGSVTSMLGWRVFNDERGWEVVSTWKEGRWSSTCGISTFKSFGNSAPKVEFSPPPNRRGWKFYFRRTNCYHR